MAQPTQQAEIKRVRDLSPHVRELVLAPLSHAIPFTPGQWVSLHLPVGTKPPLVRAYTMAEPEQPNGELVLAFDRVPEGLGSGYLWRVKPGEQLPVSGPVGRFVLPDDRTKTPLFVARYTGIVPIRCMIRWLVQHDPDRPVTLLYAAPSVEEAIYHHEFQALARVTPTFTYVHVMGSGDPAAPDAETQAVADHLRAVIRAGGSWLPMVSGIKAFVKPLRGLLSELGYDRKAVRAETYD